MGCNCGGAAGAGTRYQLVKSDGTVSGTYLSRTEAIAAMSVEPGSRVVSVN